MSSRIPTGFSLPELMVTLAVFITFSSTAVPSFAEMIDRYRAKSYVQQLSQYLAYARVAAASSNLPVVVCPGAKTTCQKEWQLYPVQLVALNPATDKQVLLRELPQVHSGHKLSYNRDSLTFRRDGSLNGFENGTFYYCAKAGSKWHYKLTLNQAGRSRLTQVSAPCPS